MPVTTRNGARSHPSTPSKVQSSTTMPKTETATIITSHAYRTARPSPYLLLLYPIILATGSLYAVISPIAHLETNTTTTTNVKTNHPHPTQPNYFASKRNLLNLLFVKQGWLWTSLAFLFLQLTTRPSSTASTPTGDKRLNYRIQAILRYTIMTASWLFMTKWFFGPSLIDRSFTLTGGHCEYPASSPQWHSSSDTTAGAASKEALGRLATKFSATACKASGGRWHGGHDLSGHVFMLVLSSAFLLYELYLTDNHDHSQQLSASTPTDKQPDSTTLRSLDPQNQAKLRVYARYFLYAVVALDGLMLLTTAIWFHTWLEKVNGMMVAGLVVYTTYFLGPWR